MEDVVHIAKGAFDLAAIPAEATAYITADTFYRLWINGQLAMHGPARSSAGKATVDPVAGSPRLGSNCTNPVARAAPARPLALLPVLGAKIPENRPDRAPVEPREPERQGGWLQLRGCHRRPVIAAHGRNLLPPLTESPG